MAMRKKRNLVVTIAVIILVVAIVLSSFVFLNSQKPYNGVVESVSIGMYPSEYYSLVYVAKDQHYFSDDGLNITLKNYQGGVASANALLSGQVDIATVSEFVIAEEALQNASISTLGSLARDQTLFVVARTDKGINQISDLKGKTIGVTLGISVQFYLGRFLQLNGINLSQVTLDNMPFTEIPNALANGTIDAAITFQPFIDQIESLIGNKIIMWPAQADQFSYVDAIATQSWIAQHPDLVVRFLKAITEAETFIINHQDQAMAIVAKNLNYTSQYMASVWPDYQFTVTLDQSFILLLQDEARWLISNNLTNATNVPNFGNYVYLAGLREVKPEAVNVIG